MCTDKHRFVIASPETIFYTPDSVYVEPFLCDLGGKKAKTENLKR